MSVSIVTDYSAIEPTDGSKLKNYDGASAEEIASLPACLEITTTELSHDGKNQRYLISGFTNATAPEFLQKIIEAAKKLEDAEGTK